MCGLVAIGLFAGCGIEANSSSTSTSTTVSVAAAAQQFQDDNGPFLDAVRSNDGFPAYEKAAGDVARLLNADRWPGAAIGDITQLVGEYRVIAAAGSDYNAVSAALDKWKTDYDQVAGDLGLPQPFRS